MPTKAEFLKAKVQAVKSVLEKTSPKEREGKVSSHLALDFNAVVKEIAAAFPEAAPHLPKPIHANLQLRHMGLSNIGFVDLMILAEQVLRVLSVVESHG